MLTVAVKTLILKDGGTTYEIQKTGRDDGYQPTTGEPSGVSGQLFLFTPEGTPTYRKTVENSVTGKVKSDIKVITGTADAARIVSSQKSYVQMTRQEFGDIGKRVVLWIPPG